MTVLLCFRVWQYWSCLPPCLQSHLSLTFAIKETFDAMRPWSPEMINRKFLMIVGVTKVDQGSQALHLFWWDSRFKTRMVPGAMGCVGPYHGLLVFLAPWGVLPEGSAPWGRKLPSILIDSGTQNLGHSAELSGPHGYLPKASSWPFQSANLGQKWSN